MKSIPKSWAIFMVCERERKINPQPQYQRAPVWNLSKKQKLIDSILRGYDIPKIYLRPCVDTQYEHEVVDGQQRLRAIWEFKNNIYPLGNDSQDLPKFGDLSELTYDDLPSEAIDEFGLFELSIVIIDKASELEIRDLFLRLQEGVSLNPAEKRNAMPGNMRDFVAKLAEHKVFQSVTMKTHIERRFGRDDWIAHIVCLETAGASVDIKARNLERMYEAYEDFDSTCSVARKVRKVLNYMARVFDTKTPELDTKWGFIDLYWVLSYLLDHYVLPGREKDFQNFYLTFEDRRRRVDDIEELIRSGDYLDRLLFDYIEAFVRSGATKKNVTTRHRVYKEWIHTLMPDLVPVDQTRSFSTEERRMIWRRANEKCQQCSVSIFFEEMHADHIVPHSRGGQTTLANAQALCSNCNKTKGNSIN